MRRRAFPRWLRTALVFLASLQAARAGSVEAQGLGASHVERATAASAPREPMPLLRAQVPDAQPMSIRIQIATSVRTCEPPIHAVGDPSPGKPPPAPIPAPACAPIAGTHLVSVGEWRPDQPGRLFHLVLQPGARRARAPSPVAAGN